MNILSEMNMKAHQGRELTPENKKLTLWRPSKEFVHCCIESNGCRFSRNNGACIMCDYGIGRNLTPVELREALDEELTPQLKSVSTLLFGTYGSILDTEEVSEKCFSVILDFVAKQRIKTVIFETHCCVVNEEILDKIQKKLMSLGIKVIIEMGYESCDTYVLKNCLNKVLDLEQLSSVIKLIHKFSMEVSLNVFLGAPFLSVQEQLETAEKSVKWAFEKGADSIVVFPCNIKPFTLIYNLYRNGLYKPVSQWMLVELLSRIPEEKLSRVTLSWYGNRKNFYDNDEFALIPPEDCVECHDDIFEFYHMFMNESVSFQRKQLVEGFIKGKKHCSCYNKFLEDFNNKKESLGTEEIKKLLNDME